MFYVKINNTATLDLSARSRFRNSRSIWCNTLPNTPADSIILTLLKLYRKIETLYLTHTHTHTGFRIF